MSDESWVLLMIWVLLGVGASGLSQVSRGVSAPIMSMLTVGAVISI